jgi:hypothetical protein
MIEVIKRSGEREVFSEEKVRRSLRRSGASKNIEDRVVGKLTKKLYSGITTEEIYQIIFRLLTKEESSLASKYNLKAAIVALGPSGHPFEMFFAGLLRTQGFQTQVSQIMKGKCVNHEVDIVAKTNGPNFLTKSKKPVCYMVECKFHGQGGVKVALKTALYVQARYQDLAETAVTCFGQTDYFTQALLATNGRVTSEALKYCWCMNLAVLSWDFPQGNALPDLISQSHQHPLTCLKTLSIPEQQLLLGQGLVFCQDLLTDQSWRQIIGGRSKKVIEEAEKIIS